MSMMQVGQLIGIPCKVYPGPFEDEMQVEFESLDGTVSGFASKSNIREKGERHFIKGEVRSVSGDIITVMVRGSFFTTNGLAKVQSTVLENLPLAA